MEPSIFFAWVTENEAFDPSVHARHDEDIFSLNIVQKEGEFATAILTSSLNFGKNKTCNSRSKSFISTVSGNEIKLLFVGYGAYTFKKIKEEEIEVELISQPYDWRLRLYEMIEKEKILPYWNAFFAKEHNLTSLEDYQDARTSSFYCDRVTGSIKRSDWFCGASSVNLGGRILRDSLQLRTVDEPLKSCTIRLHVQWLQKDQGFADISRQLMKAFPGGYIHSFSGKSLKDKWPKVGQDLSRSGYWIVRSKLKKYNDFRQRYYQKLPAFSSLFSLKDEKNKIQKYRLKRSYFKAKLWLGWQYQQKRKETLTLTLEHAVQSLFKEKGQTKTIDIYLNSKGSKEVHLWKADHSYEEGDFVQYYKKRYQAQASHKSGINFEKDKKNWTYKKDISSYEKISPESSFFLTDTGYQLAECGLEIAKQMLARSARCVEISFRGHWDDFVGLTTDHNVEIQDERLFQGTVKGKVVACRLWADGETGLKYGEATITCSVGVDPQDQEYFNSPTPTVFEEDYCQDIYQYCEGALMTSDSGISYYRYDDQVPLDGIGNLKVLHDGDIVRSINVENHSLLQEETLKMENPTTLKKANQYLNQYQTNIRIRLRDLRNQEKIEHIITLKPQFPWSSPKQICFQQEE